MTPKPTIYLGSDHAGFYLKQKMTTWLREWGYGVEDMGAHELKEEDDYPDFIIPTARAVASDPEGSRGIIIGGSGQGEAMAANRMKGVRAAVYYGGNMDIVRLSREHNDANMLSFAAWFVSEDEAKEALTMWLQTEFSGAERHVRRIHKIDT